MSRYHCVKISLLRYISTHIPIYYLTNYLVHYFMYEAIFFERKLALLAALQVFGSKGDGGREREGRGREGGELFNKNL